ncbi:DUF305 domain-containing protein [Streptomyces chitinivorans]|uniref:DUF305 domain-containing protein n=1 Tax=Streptomyces chitinivorans TaxID=1257027 RepID=A0ABW7HR75_9ACTN|nr:DUF305 domain-containing protein [Streptomyces chitinivorans]MDH2410961.1 DUF305 domain-containing protein [Streptomyces chitinivorans]
MTAHRFALRRAALAVTAATAAAVLAACGSQESSPAGHGGHDDRPAASSSAPVSAGSHNAADVSFAQGMIPHHRQAVVMAEMAETRAASQEVKDLAAAIRKAQDPEIETMSGWLESWGEQVPPKDEGTDGTDHSGHGSRGMSGMMTPEEMAELEESSGQAFDTAFLEMMIEHHKGAVAMAEDQKENGSHGPAKAMADDIITAQNAEIDAMEKLLGRK